MSNTYTVHMVSAIHNDGTIKKEIIQEDADYEKITAWFGPEAAEDLNRILDGDDYDELYSLQDLLTDPAELLDGLQDATGNTIKGVVVEWYTYCDRELVEGFNSGLAWARIDPLNGGVEKGNSSGLDLTARIKVDAEIW